MITFRCACGKPLQAREKHAGQVTACPTCGKELTIPDPEAIKGAPPQGVRQAPPAATPLPDDDHEPRPRRRPRRDDEYDDFGRRPVAPERTSGKAIASLVLGLLSLCLPGLLSILGVILGFLGLSEIKRSRGEVGGKGLAITGIITSLVSIVITIPILIGLLLVAVRTEREATARAESMKKFKQQEREAADQQQTRDNLKQIGLAFHSYHDAYRTFPPAVVFSEDGRALYSWRVALLPFLEEEGLYKEFRLNEPWDSAHNIQFLKRMPKVYAHPADPDAFSKGQTHYQVFTTSGRPDFETIFRSDTQDARPLSLPGMNRPVVGSHSRRITEIKDGTSNTILVADAATAVLWTRPEDLQFSGKGLLSQLGKLNGTTCNLLMADGAVRVLDTRRLSPQTLRAMITPDGAEVLPLD